MGGCCAGGSKPKKHNPTKKEEHFDHGNSHPKENEGHIPEPQKQEPHPEPPKEPQIHEEKPPEPENDHVQAGTHSEKERKYLVLSGFL